MEVHLESNARLIVKSPLSFPFHNRYSLER